MPIHCILLTIIVCKQTNKVKRFLSLSLSCLSTSTSSSKHFPLGSHPRSGWYRVHCPASYPNPLYPYRPMHHAVLANLPPLLDYPRRERIGFLPAKGELEWHPVSWPLPHLISDGAIGATDGLWQEGKARCNLRLLGRESHRTREYEDGVELREKGTTRFGSGTCGDS